MKEKQKTEDGRQRTDFRFLSSVLCYLSSVFCLFVCGEAFGEGLRFNFEPNDKYELISTVIQATEQVAVDGQKQISGQTVRLKSDFDIVDVEADGSAWARYTFKQVATKITAPDGTITFDSEIDVNRPRVPMQVLPLYAVLGENIYLKITPQGRITKINGLASIAGLAKGAVAGYAARNQLDSAFRLIENQFSETMMKSTLENQMAVFPDPCISTGIMGIGDTWSRTEAIGTEEEGKVVSEQIFRLKERRTSPGAPSVAVIDVNIIIRPSVDANGIAVAGIKFIREVRGQGQGQIEINESTGQIINEQFVQDLENQAKITSEGLVRRVPKAPEPSRRRLEMTFQMIKR